MTKILLILVIAFTFEALGVISLKKGIDHVTAGYRSREATTPRFKNILRMIGQGFANKEVWIGLALETIFFFCLLYLLGQKDVSFIWPLTALSFVMTTLAAKFLLHEQVNGVRWGGVLLIMLGAALISYSEHQKDGATTPQPAAATSPPAGPH